MNEELFVELIKEIRGIKEELKKQTENLKSFSDDVLKELSGIKKEINNL